VVPDLFENCETRSSKNKTYAHRRKYLQLAAVYFQTLLSVFSCIQAWSIKTHSLCAQRENSFGGKEINLSTPQWADSKFGRDFPFEGTRLQVLSICGMCCVSEPNILSCGDPCVCWRSHLQEALILLPSECLSSFSEQQE
jgi:hypothetical protein